MTIAIRLAFPALGVLALAASASAHAQGGAANSASATAREQAQLPLPAVEPPPQPFATAEEHYAYLLDKAHGGTKHTMATIPVWDGLWGGGNNSMPSLFLDGGTLATAWTPGKTKVKEGVLTPPYEKAFKERRAEIDRYGQQRYPE